MVTKLANYNTFTLKRIEATNLRYKYCGYKALEAFQIYLKKNLSNSSYKLYLGAIFGSYCITVPVSTKICKDSNSWSIK